MLLRPVLMPILRNPLQGIADGIRNMLAELLGSSQFFAPLTHSLVLARGTGSPTFTRVDPTPRATFRDWEGVLKTVPSGCARFEGARMVRNLLTFTEDIENAAWTATSAGTGTNPTKTKNYAAAPDGTTTAQRIQFSVGAGTTSGDLSAVFQLPTATTALNSLWIKSATGVDQKITLRARASSTVDDNDLTATSTWTEVSELQTGGTAIFALLQKGDWKTANTADILIWHPQLEDVTGQADQTASEYVSVGVLSAPYHGAGVDGIEFFNTDRDGAVIPAATNTGYLAEGARTNLCLQSQTLGTTWAADGSTSVTADQYVAPDGTTTMDKVTSLAVTSQHYLKQGITFSAGVTTYSFYLRYVNNQWCALVMSNGGGLLAASFDLLNGVVGALGAGTTSTIQATAIADVYRVSITGTMSAGAGYLFISPNSTDTASLQNYTAAGTETVGAWGAQVELGSSASTYIPTTTAAVTRAADVLTYPSAGNISDTAGSAYCEYSSSVVDGNYGTALSGTGTGAGRMICHYSATNAAINDSTTELQKTGLDAINTGMRKRASTWSAAPAMTVTGDGLAPATVASYDGVMAPTAIAVGYRGITSSEHINGTIRNVRLWNRQLSASEMQAITA